MHAEANILNNPFRPFPEVAAIIAPNPGFTMPGFAEARVQQSPETENTQDLNVVQSITAEMLLPQEEAGIINRAQELFTTLQPNGYYEVPFELEQDEILGILGFPAEPGSQLDRVYQQYLGRIAEINGLGGNAQLHLMLQLQNGEFFQGALAIRVQNTYTEQRLDANGTLQNRSVSRGSYVLFSQYGEHLIQPTQPDSTVTLTLENSEIASPIVLALEARGIEVAETDSAFLAVELNRNNDIVSLITNHEQIVFERQIIRRGETGANIRVLPDTNSAAITWDTALVGLPYELSQELRNTITTRHPGAVITEENGEVRVSIGQHSWQFVRSIEEGNFQDGFIRQDVSPTPIFEASPIPTADLVGNSIPEQSQLVFLEQQPYEVQQIFQAVEFPREPQIESQSFQAFVSTARLEELGFNFAATDPAIIETAYQRIVTYLASLPREYAGQEINTSEVLLAANPTLATEDRQYLGQNRAQEYNTNRENQGRGIIANLNNIILLTVTNQELQTLRDWFYESSDLPNYLNNPSLTAAMLVPIEVNRVDETGRPYAEQMLIVITAPGRIDNSSSPSIQALTNGMSTLIPSVAPSIMHGLGRGTITYAVNADRFWSVFNIGAGDNSATIPSIVITELFED